MTQFSSKPPFNDDPEPWECTAPDFERYENEWDYEGRHGVIHEPRPEYDRPQHNPTNPILTKLRSLKEPHRLSWIAVFLDQATHVRFANWTDEETEHAIKVLSKWKEVFG